MKKIFTREWFEAALIRAIRTFAQTMVGFMGEELVRIHEIDWISGLSISAAAFVLSMLMSVAGLPEVKEKEVSE